MALTYTQMIKGEFEYSEYYKEALKILERKAPLSRDSVIRFSELEVLAPEDEKELFAEMWEAIAVMTKPEIMATVPEPFTIENL